MTVANTVAADCAVRPVVDYEPQITATDTTAQPPGATRKLHLAGHPKTPARRVAGPPLPVTRSARYRAAAQFADTALRTVLEVIDLRRPPAQLRPLMASGLADSVIVFSQTMTTRRAGAVLRRVRVQACDPGEEAFEIAAAYSRGERLHAIACRIEESRTSQGRRWQIVALHIG